MCESALPGPGAARRNNYDVTGRICISDPQEVQAAVRAILAGLYPHANLGPVDDAFLTFGRLYAGWLPGYLGCDTWYHDAQHGLDCALAMARLLEGHERCEPAGRRLGARRAWLGVIIALFHDAGYIRRDGDAAHNGAEYTLTHVKRSAEFLSAYLPRIGFADQARLASRVVHFTGYEIALERIDVADPLDRMLGFLLGTADVLAQTADRCYLEKCRDWLYREFEICGLAGAARPGMPAPVYRSARELLTKTPDFNRKLWQERLDGYFGGVHRYLGAHFGSRDPYTEAVDANLARVQEMIDQGSFAGLRRRPRVIGATALRSILQPAPKAPAPAQHKRPRARAA